VYVTDLLFFEVEGRDRGFAVPGDRVVLLTLDVVVVENLVVALLGLERSVCTN
jgi:hypothetical protein